MDKILTLNIKLHMNDIYFIWFGVHPKTFLTLYWLIGYFSSRYSSQPQTLRMYLP